VLAVHASADRSALLARIAPHFSPRERERDEERFAHYQPVLRLILRDSERRLLAPERYCFRGSVDDWISIGPSERMEGLAARYLKHLGHDSMYELF
jgi:hypothetical protein